MTAPSADCSTTLSTMLAAVGALSLLAVLVSVAIGYQPRVVRKPVEAPRPRVVHIASYALV